MTVSISAAVRPSSRSGGTRWAARRLATALLSAVSSGRALLPVLLAATLVSTAGFAEGPSVRGSVIGADGEPARGLHIELIDRTLPSADSPRPSTHTDATGAFELEARAPGLFILRVLEPATAPSPATPREAGPARAPPPPAQERARVLTTLRLGPLVEDALLSPIQLGPRRSVRVTVRSGGRPVVGAPIFVGDAPDARDATPTAADGAVELSLRPDERELAVVAPGLAPQIVSSESSEPNDELVVELSPGVPRLLRVRSPTGDAAISGASIRLGSLRTPIGATDERGEIVLRFPDRRPVRLVVEDDAGRFDAEVDVPPDEKAPLEITLEPWTLLTGRVLDAETQQPVAGALVWEGEQPQRAAVTDAAGSYALRSASFDRVTGVELHVQARGFVPSRATGSGEPHTRIEMPSAALEPAWTLEGIVRDVEGHPIEGVAVAWREPGWRRTPEGGAARSDEDGRFQLWGLPFGHRLIIRATSPGFETRYGEVVAPPRRGTPETIELVLERAAWITGRLVDADGVPVAGCEVLVAHGASWWHYAPWASQVRNHYVPERATTDTEGVFLARAPASEISVRARTLGTGELSLPVIDLTALDPLSSSRGTDQIGLAIAEPEPPVFDLGTLQLERGALRRGVVVDSEGEPLAGVTLTLGVPAPPPRTSWLAFEDRLEVVSASDGSFELEGSSDLLTSLFVRAEKAGYWHPESIPVEPPHEAPLRITMLRTHTVRGYVVWSSGATAAHARVRWSTASHDSNPRMRPDETDELIADPDGGFSFRGVSEGEIILRASVAGSGVASITVELGAEADLSDEVELVLEPGAVLEGAVVGDRGEPVVGAALHVQRRREGRSGWDRLASAVADAEGLFRVEGIGAGRIQIMVRHRAYLAKTLDVELEPEGRFLEIKLARGVEVRGWVRDSRGEPVAGARIHGTHYRGSGSMSGGGVGGATTRSDGSFTIEGMEPGIYSLTAGREDGPSASTAPFRVGPDPVDGIEIVVPDGVALEGVVVGLTPWETGSSVVRASQGRPGSSSKTAWISSTDFRFRFDGLAPGTWNVYVISPAGRVEEDVLIEPGIEPAELVLQLDRGQNTVRGIVLRDGEPVAGASVSWHRPGAENQGGWAGSDATTDALGRFLLDRLPDGDITVIATFDGGHPTETLSLTGDADIVLEVESAEVEVLLTDRTTGEPVEGVEVGLFHRPSPYTSMALASGRTGPDGRAFLAASPAVVQLHARHPDYADGRVDDLDLHAGHNPQIRLELDRGEELAVLPLGADGEPIPPGLAGFTAYSAEGRSLGSVTTDDTGIARLGKLAERPAWLWLHAEGHASEIVAVASSSEPLLVRLSRGGSVRVDVPDLAATGELGFVSASAVTPWAGRKGTLSRLRAGSSIIVDGAGHIARLPAGAVELAIKAIGSQERFTVTAWIVEGETVEVIAERAEPER
ncbi:MAG TPA: carboxypeptidase regulatory-like domain-containing protein [Thermoanaerobaculia bacterium]|nr:carboxypeptidase regulatory-like domain-containing protein [Thermoanaerobaculia bacterium]